MKAKPKTKDHAWEITRIRGKAAAFIGYVHAPDGKTAIELAIKQFNVKNPNDQQRLAARCR